MQQKKYVMNHGYADEDLQILNENGKDGWELCGVNRINYYFKREIME